MNFFKKLLVMSTSIIPLFLHAHSSDTSSQFKSNLFNSTPPVIGALKSESKDTKTISGASKFAEEAQSTCQNMDKNTDNLNNCIKLINKWTQDIGNSGQSNGEDKKTLVKDLTSEINKVLSLPAFDSADRAERVKFMEQFEKFIPMANGVMEQERGYRISLGKIKAKMDRRKNSLNKK